MCERVGVVVCACVVVDVTVVPGMYSVCTCAGETLRMGACKREDVTAVMKACLSLVIQTATHISVFSRLLRVYDCALLCEQAPEARPRMADIATSLFKSPG